MQQPDMAPFSPAGGRGAAEAPSPISSRPPAPGQQQQLDELGGTSGSGGSGSLAHEGLAGEEGERSGSSAGNRWPRQETLALLKIRSEMDAAFREAALKGPLWEEVSRRLAEMGYRRSAKKCREKFENVDKYYKRTKDGRAGRGDGKAYRFFSELEALHGAASAHPPTVSLAPTPVTMVLPVTPVGASGPSAARVHAEPPPPLVPQSAAPRPTDAAACVMTMGDVSFLLGSEGSDGEDTEETAEGGKRKRHSGGRGGGGEAMRFFERLMRQVMERQEAMQHRLLEAIERREQDRMIREEAWRRQEVARLAREHDALTRERAMAASRDAAVISFIQRVTGQTIQLPSIAAPAAITSLIPPPLQPTPVASAAPAPPPSQHQQAPPVQPQQPHIMPMTPQPQPMHAQSKEVVRAPEPQDMAGSGGGGPSSSRWPKAEVHALIQLRTELGTRYQEAGPKGPLWEDISAGMRRLGYSRSAKRCKEKWENINKYFKKVKESNKKRPEDSKTCPYYHQLEELYRSKALASSSAGAGGVNESPRPEAAVTVLAAVPLSQTAPAHAEHGGNNCSNGNGNGCASRDNGGSSGGMQMKASNGGVAARFSVEGGAGGGNGMATNKLGLKQEGVVKETTTTEQTQQPVAMNNDYGIDRLEDMDSDSMDEDDEEFDDEDDDVGGVKTQVQYDIHFQRQQQNQNVVRPNASGGGGNTPATGPAAPAGTAAATTSRGGPRTKIEWGHAYVL